MKLHRSTFQDAGYRRYEDPFHGGIMYQKRVKDDNDETMYFINVNCLTLEIKDSRDRIFWSAESRLYLSENEFFDFTLSKNRLQDMSVSDMEERFHEMWKHNGCVNDPHN